MDPELLQVVVNARKVTRAGMKMMTPPATGMTTHHPTEMMMVEKLALLDHTQVTSLKSMPPLPLPSLPVSHQPLAQKVSRSWNGIIPQCK